MAFGLPTSPVLFGFLRVGHATLSMWSVYDVRAAVELLSWTFFKIFIILFSLNNAPILFTFCSQNVPCK